ncbi:NAD(P)H:quinone oxidoreductase [bacterium]|nr:NAD(P)H:quinone oxidoreductase [bacterium]
MRILVVYYSLTAHTLKMARAVVKGVERVDGVEPVLRRVRELEMMQEKIDKSENLKRIQEEQRDIPECTLDDLREADGIIFGSPTRYGNMTAQMKALFDSTAQLWLKGELEGKPAGVFTSTASSHGGQETTLFTMMAPIIHLGMIVVGVPYSVKELLHTEGRGGTPYGPSTIAGPQGELEPAPEDLRIAEALGERVAKVTLRLRGSGKRE